MKSIKLTLLFLGLLIAVNTFSQSDYRKGYIITNKQDTIYGLIDYASPSSNAQTCFFKRSESAVVEKYKPFEIQGYRFTDSKYYVSKQVKVENDSMNLFLEYIIKGAADLYYYCSPGLKSTYYIQKGNGTIMELSNNEIVVKDNDRDFIRKDNRYIGVLKYTMSDCPSIFNDIDKTRLTSESLTSITEKYHNKTCTSYNCIVFEKKEPASVFHWSPFIRLSNVNYHLVSTDVSNESDQYAYSYTINVQKITPAIGLKASFISPWISEKLTLEVASAFSSVKFNDKYVDDVLSANDTKFSLSYQDIEVMAGFKYLFTIKKIRPNIGGGFEFNQLFNTKTTLIQFINYPAATAYFYPDLPKRYLGYYINAGADYMITEKQFISLSLIYSTGGGSCESMNQVGLQLGYTF